MKNLAVCLATCGLIFASCSSNDVFEENNDVHSQDNINFSANTTRAIINDLTEVKKGFKVFATKTGSDPWFIEGDIYKFENDKWDWPLISSNEHKKYPWPTTAAGYPMNFYAYYPQTANGFSPSVAVPGTLTANITIESDPVDQQDFLAANYKNVTTKPASGKLNLSFKHITSKVNFSVIVGIGSSVFVQQLHMQNVGNTGAFDYNNLVWDTFTDAYPGKYKYYPTVIVPGTTEALPTFKPASPTTEETKYPVYANEDKRHMMLRPQTYTPGWTWVQTKPAPTTPIVPAEAYIESVYRIEANGDANAVGYESAVNHPNYKGSALETSSYSGPLFVKVGFPLGETLTWEQGKGYMYSLMLGTAAGTGGIIIDDNYYDDKGNRTDLTIDGKDIGDPVNDGDIHFNVDVTEWGDDSDITQ